MRNRLPFPPKRASSPASSSPAASSPRPRTWPWALGTVVVVAVVLLAAVGARRVVASTRSAAKSVAAPSMPAASVAGATPVNTFVRLAALDPTAGHLVALTSTAQPQCPPANACPPAPPLTAFAVFDAATGQPLATTPLAASSTAARASASVLLLADPSHSRAYAVSPSAVTLFSTVTGAATGGYALPTVSWQHETGGALDPQRGVLVLAGAGQLLTVDAATGRPLASRALDAGTAPAGLTLDPASSTIYTLLQRPGASQPTLAAYDETTLAPTFETSLPAGARLGPLDSATGTLYLPGAASGQCAYSLTAQRLTTAPDGVCDALALGWNAATGHLYTSDGAGLTLRDAATGRALAALPVRAAWPGDRPLLVDTTRGLLYIPDDRGTVVIVRDSPPSASLTPGGALLLARAALADLLPDTNQDPPFVAPETFPAAPGTRPEAYWIHFSDLGWQGPYPGSAASAVRPLPGASGGYEVTFTISWNQLFQRTHSWTCDESPDGAVRLVSETGDAVP